MSQPSTRSKYDIDQQITIDAAAEAVWKWVATDTDLELSWRNIDGRGVQSLERLDDGELEVGSRFRGTVQMGAGEPKVYVNEVTAVTPHRHIAWKTIESDGALSGLGEYDVEPIGGGTRFRIKLDYPPKSLLGRIQRPIVRLVGGRFISKMLEKLKRSVEAGAQA